MTARRKTYICRMLQSILLVGCGSALGGICRFLSTRCISKFFPAMGHFPLGTFAVNLVGCLLIGLFYGLSEHTLSPNARLFLTVGFCGGLTTFSTFANENLQLFRDGNVLMFALYAAGSVFFGILAVHLGSLAAKLLI